MSVKTLSSAQPMVLPASISHARTYSVAPSPAYIPEQIAYPSAAEIDSFLQEENPLGCIRGVMWVMVFNITVFVIGLTLWQCIKFLM